MCGRVDPTSDIIMTYIISHDFDQDIPYFVKVIDQENFDEIYNPKFATLFNTEKEARQWIDIYSSMKDYSKIVDYDKSVEKFLDWFSRGTVRRNLHCINRTKSRPYNNESIDEVIDWWIWYANNNDQIDYEDYKTWPKLYEITKHLWDIQSYHSSDYEELYITFELYTKKSGSFKEFECELNKIIGQVTHKDEEGYLIFPIMDHYLAEYGNSVSLLIHSETKEVKISGRWYDDQDLSLEDAFKFLKKERYYE